MSFESAMFNSQKSFQRCDTYSQCIWPPYVIPLPYDSWRFANNCKNKISHQLMQPRPQGLLLVQNGGSEKPWARLLKYTKNCGVFCHLTRDEMAFSEAVSSVWWPCLFSSILKPLFKQNENISSCFTCQNPHEFLQPFWQP